MQHRPLLCVCVQHADRVHGQTMQTGKFSEARHGSDRHRLVDKSYPRGLAGSCWYIACEDHFALCGQLLHRECTNADQALTNQYDLSYSESLPIKEGCVKLQTVADLMRPTAIETARQVMGTDDIVARSPRSLTSYCIYSTDWRQTPRHRDHSTRHASATSSQNSIKEGEGLYLYARNHACV